MVETKKNQLKELLERLEVESWQLELLVSGFAIFLIGSSFDPILKFGSKIVALGDGFSNDFDLYMVLPSGLLACAFFIFVNLLLHLIFRGLWISAIGIRFLSGDIDFSKLNFTRPFDKYLGKKLTSFDFYIERLERISSVIFGFTFLIVFSVLSLMMIFLFIQFITFLVNWIFPDLSEKQRIITFSVIGFVFMLGSLLYFLDFVTLGLFKRKRWIAIWYYPIYRFFSFITFSNVYRPIYYNLIDNPFGKRVVLFLVPYMFFTGSLSSIKASNFAFFPEENDSFILSDNVYEDSRKENKRIKTATIQSKFISNGFVDLFIRWQSIFDQKTLEEKFPQLNPIKEEGFQWLLYHPQRETSSPSDSIIQAMSALYQLSVNDSIFSNPEFYFYTTKKYKQEGIKTIIDVNYLPRGSHKLHIHKYNSSDSLYHYCTIPFWKE